MKGAERCPVCAHVQRARIDEALAAGQSANQLSRAFLNLSRPQIATHRKSCLLGSPLAVHLLRTGRLSEEEFATRLRESEMPGDAVEGVLAAFREVVSGEACSRA